MKNTFKTVITALTLIAITFTACKDDDTTITPETPAVNFSITDPTGGTMFGKGDTIHINGMVTWEKELNG